MDLFTASPASMLVLGATGGSLNALFTDNLHWFPHAVPLGNGRRVARFGFIANVAVGAAAAFVVLTALGDGSCAGGDRSLWSTAMLALGQICLGLAGAHALTSESDKRLLRAAACKACAAPAAHPDSVRALEIGSPYEAYTIAERLTPRRASFTQRED